MIEALDEIAGTRSDGAVERASELVEAFRGDGAFSQRATEGEPPTLAVQDAATKCGGVTP
jgi:hypothetical protein